MAKELDNKKMWGSVLEELYHRPIKESLMLCIKNALRDQGFEYKDGEIVPIEQEQDSPVLSNSLNTGKDDEELTEFEEALINICFWLPSRHEKAKDYIKMNSCTLFSIARKQIESEEHLGITHEEFEKELQLLYKYADEVQYKRGYQKAIEDAGTWLEKHLYEYSEPVSITCHDFIEIFKESFKKGE